MVEFHRPLYRFIEAMTVINLFCTVGEIAVNLLLFAYHCKINRFDFSDQSQRRRFMILYDKVKQGRIVQVIYSLVLLIPSLIAMSKGSDWLKY